MLDGHCVSAPEHAPYRFWWGETSDAPAVAATSMPLAEVLAGWVPSSMPQPWTWDDEERAIFERACLCCGQIGHHQRQLEAFLAEYGLSEGVCLGECGRVFDGHHRIVAARRLGIAVLPLESLEDSGARWVRDYGPVSWENREKGDMPADLYRQRMCDSCGSVAPLTYSASHDAHFCPACLQREVPDERDPS